MHVWWNYPPCIQRCNKECLPFNTTLVLRGFVPRFSVTPRLAPAPPRPPGARQHRALHRLREGPSSSAPLPVPSSPGLWRIPSSHANQAQTQPAGQKGPQVFIPSRTQPVPGAALLQGSGPPTLPLPLRHLGTPSCSCARCSSGEHSVSRLPERRAARQRVPKMRSRVQATTREEKSDRWLDSGGATRKHEAGKGTAREGWGQGVPQR